MFLEVVWYGICTGDRIRKRRLKNKEKYTRIAQLQCISCPQIVYSIWLTLIEVAFSPGGFQELSLCRLPRMHLI